MTTHLAAFGSWRAFLADGGRQQLARLVLADHLRAQRWFPARARTIAHLEVEDAVALDEADGVLLVVAADYADGGRDRFAVPVARATGEAARAIASASPARVIAHIDAPQPCLVHDDLTGPLGAALLGAIARRGTWPAERGAIRGEPTGALAALGGVDPHMPARQVTAEQSNTSVIFGDRLILKLIRRLEPGLNPDFEIGRHLTDVVRFPGVPALGGALLWEGAFDRPVVLAILQAFVPGALVLRERIVEEVASLMRSQAARAGAAAGDAPMRAASADLFAQVRALGTRTGALHLALADDRGDPGFAPEPATADDLAAVARDMQAQTVRALDVLAGRADALPPTTREAAAAVLARRGDLLAAIGRVASLTPGVRRIRVHGDFQLDQVLVAGTDLVIIDFEGEPLRPLAERSAKFLALKDVAGMVRSYSYAAYAGLFAACGDDEALAARLDPVARWWQAEAGRAFVEAYRTAVGPAPFVPAGDGEFRTLLEAFVVEKATYELRYELNHRPGWLRIPLRGIAAVGTGS